MSFYKLLELDLNNSNLKVSIIEAIVRIIIFKDYASQVDQFNTLYNIARNEGIQEEINLFINYIIKLDNSPLEPLNIVDDLILRVTKDYYIRYQIEIENQDKDT